MMRARLFLPLVLRVTPLSKDLKIVNTLQLSIQAIKRDLRSGQLKMLLLSTALSVAALSSVGFLSNRLESGLDRDARQMLGGDAVVTSSSTTPQDIIDEAKSRGLSTALTLSFPTMARSESTQSDAQTRLVSLKAVDSSYP